MCLHVDHGETGGDRMCTILHKSSHDFKGRLKPAVSANFEAWSILWAHIILKRIDEDLTGCMYDSAFAICTYHICESWYLRIPSKQHLATHQWSRSTQAEWCEVSDVYVPGQKRTLSSLWKWTRKTCGLVQCMLAMQDRLCWSSDAPRGIWFCFVPLKLGARGHYGGKLQ